MSAFYRCFYCYHSCFTALCYKNSSDNLLPCFFNFPMFCLHYGQQLDYPLFVQRLALSWLINHSSFLLVDSGV